MEEKLPKVISDMLTKIAVESKEGQLLLIGYLQAKDIDVKKIRLNGEFILTTE